MNAFISPTGNPEVWDEKPEGYFTYEEWTLQNPPEERGSPEDAVSAEENRRFLYMAEVDDYFKQAQFYEAEAKGLRLLEQETAAIEADRRALEFFRQYAEKKLEIRALYPDEEENEKYILNSSGTYHYESCTHASESGQRLILENILLVNPSAKPCGTCQPPPVHTE